MKKECIYSLKNSYRDDLNIYGYRFGRGRTICAMVPETTLKNKVLVCDFALADHVGRPGEV